MTAYRLSYRRRIRLCRIVTLENLNEPIPIETTILYCNNLHLAQLPKTPRLRCKSVAGHSTCEWIGNLNNLQILDCRNNLFTKEVNYIIYKYPRFSNKAQEMLQELRDAYLISTDNSFTLKCEIVFFTKAQRTNQDTMQNKNKMIFFIINY
jgi:hypothetical protein